MKYPAFLSLALAISVTLPNTVDARIGESRSTFERRLFASGGIVYRDREERTTRRQSGPYSPYLDFLGSSADVRIYFKSDDGSKPSQSDLAEDEGEGGMETGWEVHVLYIRGKSVLELYKRKGSMSEYEMNALLSKLSGGAYWKEIEVAVTDTEDSAGATGVSDPEEEEEENPTAFGFQYVRSDGAVRASKTGGGLMVFQTQFDEYLAKKEKSLLIQQAPQSVEGF